ncbi:MAG: SDR family NAD(P)-dependent oxidoreductase [bacterium]
MTAENQVVLITGASRGLGMHLALGFARPGYRVAVHYGSRSGEAEEVAASVRRQGGEALPFTADLSEPAQAEEMVHRILDIWGGIHILINNAAIIRDAPAVSMPEKDWDAVMDLDLSGPFHAMRAVSGPMRDQGGGEIINMVSIAGVRGSAGQANYAAAKAALIGLTKSAAREWGPFNIRVNAVCPGFMETDMTRSVPEQVRSLALEQSCLSGFCDTGDLVRFIRALVTMRTVTGQVFHLDSRII